MKLTKPAQKAIDAFVLARLSLNEKALSTMYSLRLIELETKFQEALKKLDAQYDALNTEIHDRIRIVEKTYDEFMAEERASNARNEASRDKQLKEIDRHNALIEGGLKTLVDLVGHLTGKKKNK